MRVISTSGLRMVAAVVVAAALSVGVTACGSSGSDVEATLGEFRVVPDPKTVDAGEVKFTADNRGALTHELVVVRAASADELPTDETGAVDEDKLPDGALVGEIEDIASQSSKSKSLDLSAGSYVLFCNLSEDASGNATQSHFAQGMHAELEVR